jgi:hypothetical protein
MRAPSFVGFRVSWDSSLSLSCLNPETGGLFFLSGEISPKIYKLKNEKMK